MARPRYGCFSERKINMGGAEFDCLIKKGDSLKKIRIRFDSCRRIIVSAPINLEDEFIERIVLENSSRLLKIAVFLSDKIDLRGAGGDFVKYKERAKILVENKLAYYRKKFGFEFNRVSIKNQSRRWGSCSANGNLSFNYRIIFLSEDVADYLVVHELCHLKELNHSFDFWRLVEKIIPDYKERRKKLKKTILH